MTHEWNKTEHTFSLWIKHLTNPSSEGVKRGIFNGVTNYDIPSNNLDALYEVEDDDFFRINISLN